MPRRLGVEHVAGSNLLCGGRVVLEGSLVGRFLARTSGLESLNPMTTWGGTQCRVNPNLLLGKHPLRLQRQNSGGGWPASRVSPLCPLFALDVSIRDLASNSTGDPHRERVKGANDYICGIHVAFGFFFAPKAEAEVLGRSWGGGWWTFRGWVSLQPSNTDSPVPSWLVDTYLERCIFRSVLAWCRGRCREPLSHSWWAGRRDERYGGPMCWTSRVG